MDMEGFDQNNVWRLRLARYFQKALGCAELSPIYLESVQLQSLFKEFEEGVPDTTYRKVVSYGLPFTTDKIQSGKVTHDRTGYFNKIGGGRSKAWT